MNNARYCASMLPVIVLLAALMTTACDGDHSDLDAVNMSDTGPYDVLAQHSTEPGVLTMRVRVADLKQGEQIAAELAEQKAPQSYRRIEFEILGPGDAPTGPARQRLVWPDQVDYR